MIFLRSLDLSVWQDSMKHSIMTRNSKLAEISRMVRKTSLLGMLFVSMLLLCSCTDSPLDPDKPVTLTMWHVYGAQARSPMNILIDRFNQTVGKNRGLLLMSLPSAVPGTFMMNLWRQPVKSREAKNCLTFSPVIPRHWPLSGIQESWTGKSILVKKSCKTMFRPFLKRV